MPAIRVAAIPQLVAQHFILDWIGLDWIGLDWIVLDWIGLDWIGLVMKNGYNYNDIFIIVFCICAIVFVQSLKRKTPPDHFQGVEGGAINVGIFQCGHTQFRITQIRHC